MSFLSKSPIAPPIHVELWSRGPAVAELARRVVQILDTTDLGPERLSVVLQLAQVIAICRTCDGVSVLTNIYEGHAFVDLGSRGVEVEALASRVIAFLQAADLVRSGRCADILLLAQVVIGCRICDARDSPAAMAIQVEKAS